MTKEELSAWALANGWQPIDGHLSLTKPSAPVSAIVRLVLKATVASLEIKKPAGKWEKIASESYSKIEPNPEIRYTRGIGARHNIRTHFIDEGQQRPVGFWKIEHAHAMKTYIR